MLFFSTLGTVVVGIGEVVFPLLVGCITLPVCCEAWIVVGFIVAFVMVLSGEAVGGASVPGLVGVDGFVVVCVGT